MFLFHFIEDIYNNFKNVQFLVCQFAYYDYFQSGG